MVQARSDVQILLERFNEWADERIIDFSFTMRDPTRIDTLELAKKNLKR